MAEIHFPTIDPLDLHKIGLEAINLGQNTPRISFINNPSWPPALVYK